LLATGSHEALAAIGQAVVEKVRRAEMRVGMVLPAGITASIVLYQHAVSDVSSLFDTLSREAGLSAWAVVNNGGAEEACAAAAALGARCFHPDENLGFGAGNNFAIRELLHAGKYHLLVNPDIRFGAGVLDALYGFMEEHAEIGLVMPRVLYPDGSEQHLCKLLPGPFDLFLRRFLGQIGEVRLSRRWRAYEMQDIDLTVEREVPCLSGCFMFLRASALREVGGFDERFFMYMEDVDLCRRIGSCYKTVFYPHVSVTHEYAKGSCRSGKLLGYHLRSAVRYFNKWGWFRDPERDRLNGRTAPIRSNCSKSFGSAPQVPSPRERSAL
jgi:hypothetical protein